MDWPVLSSPSDRYRPDIDGLRAVAVMLVVLYHAFPQAMPGGFVGVDIFFVISGFLITGIIARELDQRRFSLLGFYNRRIRRIFPALIVVLCAVLVLGLLWMLPSAYAQLSADVFRQRGVRRQYRAMAAIGLFRRRGRQKAAAASVVARHRGAVLSVLAADPDARRAIAPQFACGGLPSSGLRHLRSTSR